MAAMAGPMASMAQSNNYKAQPWVGPGGPQGQQGMGQQRGPDFGSLFQMLGQGQQQPQNNMGGWGSPSYQTAPQAPQQSDFFQQLFGGSNSQLA